MITIPQNLKFCTNVVSGIETERFVGFNSIDIDPAHITMLSNDPFVFEHNGDKFFLTSNATAVVPDDCVYALQTKRQPSKAALKRGNITYLHWLKHPEYSPFTTDDIVNSWDGKFLYKKENNEAPGLRIPQLGALHAFLSHAQMPDGRGIIVMPTGTGKTETMLSTLIANQCRKLLVLVPFDALRGQIADKFITLGKLREYGIVSPDAVCPCVTQIDRSPSNMEEWQHVIDASNVVVTTMSILTRCNKETLTLLDSAFSNVFVDEAHHSEAEGWGQTLHYFDNKKVTMFTATPFRNDGKKIQGKYLYTFPLREAQKQGYYKPITFITVREYDDSLKDKAIAAKAIEKLREDIANGYDHILMARCSTKVRAKEVFEYYKEQEDLSPVVVYSGIADKEKIVNEIKLKRHKIVVCVNMLGEGFDLPEMKIAALHDARQSLPVTLQFIGRFTRTTRDTQLGEASVIANLADKPMEEDLRDLYSRDADWNRLLPLLNDGVTQEEIDFNQYIQEFSNFNEPKIPLQSVQPAMSAVIYRLDTNQWDPNKWKDVFTEEEYDYRFCTTHSDGNTLVIILGRKEPVDFGRFEGITDVVWGIVIVHRRIMPHYKHAYINTSIGIDTKKLIQTIVSPTSTQITGPHLFRVFYGVSRFAVQTFGGKKGNPGNISFKSFIGKDVEEGIRLTEQKELSKNNIFGIGYKDGERISIGCSIKGKVWSYMRGNIKMFCKWSEAMGALIEDNTINEDIVLDNTLKIHRIGSCPPVRPLSIEWDDDIYRHPERTYAVIKDLANQYPIDNVNLELVDAKENSTHIRFSISNENIKSFYKIAYSANGDGEYTLYSYKIEQESGDKLSFKSGTKVYDDICDYFNENDNAPVVFFVDGAQLFANNYVEVKNHPSPISLNAIEGIEWGATDLSHESQHVAPYDTSSIQYYFSQRIMNDYDVLYDDDNSGEIADLIGIKDGEDAIHVHLYHLKYASGGTVSDQITNFYEVCGQALKCLKWRDRDMAKKFFDHLFMRKIKKHGETSGSRFLHGTEEILEKFASDANWKKDLKFHVYIVQPALSASSANAGEIFNLLGCVASFMKDTANVDLKVYCSK